jgi:pimeloyl-ACP methyl ester carboxylesterase
MTDDTASDPCQKQYSSRYHTQFYNWKISEQVQYPIHYIHRSPSSSSLRSTASATSISRPAAARHVILLHGFGAYTFTWRYLIEPLSRLDGVHVWCFDFLGFGFSAKPLNAPYSPRLFVYQLLYFMQHFGLERAVLVGHSMGGGVALEFSLLYPQLVRGLVLLAPVCYPLKLPRHWRLARALTPLLRFVSGQWLIKALLHHNALHSFSIDDDLEVKAYAAAYQCSKATMIASVRTLKAFNNDEIAYFCQFYPLLTMPVQLIWGRHDPTIPLAHAYRFVHHCRTAQLCVLENAGHMPNEEQPGETYECIHEFLKKITWL